MLSKRAWIGVGIGALAVAALASIRWVEIKRETYYNGGVQRQYRILGRFDFTSMREDRRIEASRIVSDKFTEYGLAPPAEGDSPVVDVESSKTEFTIFKDGQGDIRQESGRLAKSSPWLSQVWTGSRHTHLYARGRHPKLGGFVEVSCSRLPERKHGPNKLRYTISVTE